LFIFYISTLKLSYNTLKKSILKKSNQELFGIAIQVVFGFLKKKHQFNIFFMNKKHFEKILSLEFKTIKKHLTF
jgi:hypothetical protein